MKKTQTRAERANKKRLKRKQKERKKAMEISPQQMQQMQAKMAQAQGQAQQPQTPQEAVVRMKQQLDGITNQIGQDRTNYANSFVSVAAVAARELLVANPNDMPVEVAVEIGFKFMEAFRLATPAHIERLKEEAPVAPQLLAQQAEITDALVKTEKICEQAQADLDALKTEQAANADAQDMDGTPPAAVANISPDSV